MPAFTFDPENRLIQVDAGNTAIYTYDGEGRRASKDDTGSVNSGGNTPDPSGTTEFVYDPAGHLVHTEAPNAGTGWRGEVFAGNRHLATYNGGADISHSDWLGTERNRDTVTSDTQQLYTQNLTSLPFGDWLDNGQGLGADWTPLNFTGQYHDFESNLDYFGARYDSSSMGRFMSPDPIGGRPAFPQSWNLYTYVANNPINAVDPTGLDCVFITDNAAQLMRGDCQHVPNDATNLRTWSGRSEIGRVRFQRGHVDRELYPVWRHGDRPFCNRRLVASVVK